MPEFKDFLARMTDSMPLSEDESEAAFSILMAGEASEAQIGAFLMGLRLRGESVDEITGAARALRAKALRVTAPAGAIDTCGTGGDAKGSFNVSTAAAIVVAACGVPVAKHGNKALTSKSGSADLLTALGVNIEAGPEVMEKAMQEAHIGFLMAPLHHQAMRHVAKARSELGTRTIFNLLGPLANPAGAKRQLVGVFARHWVEPLAEVMGRLGVERAWVVHGHDGLDEITTTGPTDVAELNGGKVCGFTVTPADGGLAEAKPEDLRGGDAAANAATFNLLLDGEKGPVRDIVLFNAAAALVIAERAADLKEGVALAAQAVDSGAARATLDKLVAITQGGK